MAKFLLGFLVGIGVAVAASVIVLRADDEPLSTFRPYELIDEPMTELEMDSPAGTYKFRGTTPRWESSAPISYQ